MRVELVETQCPRCCSGMICYGAWSECLECGFLDGDYPERVGELHKAIYGGVDSRDGGGKKC